MLRDGKLPGIGNRLGERRRSHGVKSSVSVVLVNDEDDDDDDDDDIDEDDVVDNMSELGCGEDDDASDDTNGAVGLVKLFVECDTAEKPESGLD